MATFVGLYLLDVLVCISVMMSVAMAAMQAMNRDEKKLSAFDVKPGAGRQQFAQDLVTHTLKWAVKTGLVFRLIKMMAYHGCW